MGSEMCIRDRCVSEHVRAPADSCLCNCCIIRLGVLRCLGGSHCDRGRSLGVQISLDYLSDAFSSVSCSSVSYGAWSSGLLSICSRLVNFYQCPVNPSKFVYFRSVEPSSSSCCLGVSVNGRGLLHSRILSLFVDTVSLSPLVLSEPSPPFVKLDKL